MRIEMKGLLVAVAAALGVLGATFGVSALVRQGQAGAATKRTAPASATAAAKPGGPGGAVNAALVAQGLSFYAQSCASCHGPDAKGGYGPNLHGEDMTDAQIADIIKNGVKGQMPAFGAKYGEPQTQALVAYLRTLK